MVPPEELLEVLYGAQLRAGFHQTHDRQIQQELVAQCIQSASLGRFVQHLVGQGMCGTHVLCGGQRHCSARLCLEQGVLSRRARDP